MGNVRRFVVVAAAAFLGALATAWPASAHSDIVSTDPDSGVVITDPIDTITLVFVAPIELVGPGFQLVERNGMIREPTTIDTVDSLTWVLGFEPPIIAESGLRWSLRSADSHVINGRLDLIVDIAPATPQADTAATDAQVIARESSQAGWPFEQVDRDLGEAEDGAAEEQALEPSGARLTSAEEVAGEQTATDVVDRAPVVSSDLVAYLGRLLSMLGTMLGVGSLVFLLRLLRGTTGEGRFLLTLIRRSAVVITLGVIAESTAQVVAEAGVLAQVGSWWAGAGDLAPRFAGAQALRLLGAFGLVAGCHFQRLEIGFEDSDVILAKLPTVGALAATPRGDNATNHPPLASADRVGASMTPLLFKWKASWSSLGAILGAVALLVAAGIDGHTLQTDLPLLTAFSAMVHVLAGSVWLGGVFVLLTLLYRRFRAHRRAEAVDLAVRYSVVASMALVAVGVAGMALTIGRIASIDELWRTDWGRLVLAKMSLVAVAATYGAINHFVLVPRLAARSLNIGIGVLLRRVISIEIALLVVVVVLSAQLVATAI